MLLRGIVSQRRAAITTHAESHAPSASCSDATKGMGRTPYTYFDEARAATGGRLPRFTTAAVRRMRCRL